MFYETFLSFIWPLLIGKNQYAEHLECRVLVSFIKLLLRYFYFKGYYILN